MKKIKPIEHWFVWNALAHLIRIFLAASSFFIVIAITAAVIFRYVLKIDLFGLEEIEILLAMWIYFMGGIYGSYERSHISADIMNVVVKSSTVKRWLRLFVSAVSLFVSVFFAMWSWKYCSLIFRLGGRTPGLKIPLVAQKIPLVVGFTAMIIFNVYHFICDLMGRKPLILDAEEEMDSNEAKEDAV